MIIEGLVTSLDMEGRLNISAMGAVADGLPHQIVLRPFRSSVTYRNLQLLPEGVFHVTDNASLLAKAAIDRLDDPPRITPAENVRGWIIEDTCQYHEFRVVDPGPPAERAHWICQIVRSGRRRDFGGFNRAKHALLELAILASRLHLLPTETVQQALTHYQPLVDKTGGLDEILAWRMLQEYIQQQLEQKSFIE